MRGIGNVVSWETVTDEPVSWGDTTVKPQHMEVTVRLPLRRMEGYKGAMVQPSWLWHRPVAVLVEQGGKTKRLPIIDVTRLAQIGVLLFGLMIRLALSVAIAKRRLRNESESRHHISK